MPAETSVGATEVAASNGIAHVVAPSAAVYLPVSQSVHAALPAPALNLPAAQSTHAPPSGPVEPALQMHADAALSAGEKELAGHASHVVLALAPSAAEYLPATYWLEGIQGKAKP